MARAGERFGKRKVIAMLVGNLEGLPEPLKNLSTTGLLSEEDPKKIERWVDAAVGAGLLRASDDVYRTLSLTFPGREVMAGRATDAELTLPEPPRPRLPRGKTKRLLAARNKGPAAALTADEPDETDHILLAELKAWRRREAANRSVPPYVVFHDSTLAMIASLRPRSLEALMEVPGIGPAKLAAYGQALLAVIGPG